jgi:hypothetical protein
MLLSDILGNSEPTAKPQTPRKRRKRVPNPRQLQMDLPEQEGLRQQVADATSCVCDCGQLATTLADHCQALCKARCAGL